MQNVIEFYIKYFSYCRKVAFGIWGQRLTLAQFGPKELWKSRVLVPVFTNKASVYTEC